MRFLALTAWLFAALSCGAQDKNTKNSSSESSRDESGNHDNDNDSAEQERRVDEQAPQRSDDETNSGPRRPAYENVTPLSAQTIYPDWQLYGEMEDGPRLWWMTVSQIDIYSAILTISHDTRNPGELKTVDENIELSADSTLVAEHLRQRKSSFIEITDGNAKVEFYRDNNTSECYATRIKKGLLTSVAIFRGLCP